MLHLSLKCLSPSGEKQPASSHAISLWRKKKKHKKTSIWEMAHELADYELLYQNKSGYILFCCQYNTPNNSQIPSSSGTTSRKITDVGRLEGKVKVISGSQSCLVQNQKQNTGIRVQSLLNYLCLQI